MLAPTLGERLAFVTLLPPDRRQFEAAELVRWCDAAIALAYAADARDLASARYDAAEAAMIDAFSAATLEARDTALSEAAASLADFVRVLDEWRAVNAPRGG